MNTNFKTRKASLGSLAGRATPPAKAARVLAAAGGKTVTVAAFGSTI